MKEKQNGEGDKKMPIFGDINSHKRVPVNFNTLSFVFTLK